MKRVPGHTHLYRRENGSYYFRARVPADLVAVLGKGEVKESLRTKDRREAERRVRARAVEWDNQCDHERRKRDALDAPERAILTNDTLHRMAARLYREKTEDLDRWLAEDEPDPASAEANLDALADQWVDPLRTYDGEPIEAQIPPTIRAEVTHALEQEGHLISDDTETFERAYRALANAAWKAVKWARKRAHGDFTVSPHRPSKSKPTGHPQAPSPITVGQLIDEYTNDPARAQLSPKTQVSYAVSFRALRELIGEHKAVDSITRADLRDIRKVLLKLPSNATKRFKGKTLRQAADMGARQGIAPVSKATVNGYLNNLSALFKWAVREEYLATNPAEGLAVPDNRRAKDKRSELPPVSTGHPTIGFEPG